jgi:hypothetical protein
MPSRTESLHPPGHPATAAMLWEAIKHTFCSREWKLVDAHKTGDHMRNQKTVSLRRSSHATKRAYASYGFSLWCCAGRVTALRVLDLPPDGPICLTNLTASCSSQWRTGATRFWLKRSSSLYASTYCSDLFFAGMECTYQREHLQ